MIGYYLLIYGGIHDLLTGNLWSPYYTQRTPLDCRCSNGIFAYPGLVRRWRNFPPVAVKHWPWRMSASRGKHALRKPSLYQSQIVFTVFISTFMTLETCNFQPKQSHWFLSINCSARCLHDLSRICIVFHQIKP